MWYFFKQVLFYFVYLLFMAVIALAVTSIQIVALKAILLVLCIALYSFIVITSSIKDGSEAMKKLHSNDIERRNMIETGVAKDLKTAPEYRPWKGFFVGILVATPLIICMIIHAILTATTGAAGAGAVAGLGYMMFYSMYSAFLPAAVLEAGWHYFILLYAVIYLALLCGIPYMIGARKMQKQYDAIEEKQKAIYGDNK